MGKGGGRKQKQGGDVDVEYIGPTVPAQLDYMYMHTRAALAGEAIDLMFNRHAILSD